MRHHDTIFALSTPLARSAVAVIRVSGPSSLATLQTLTGKKEFSHGMASYCAFSDDAHIIDRGLALFFAGPKSFTGEDCAELHLHGSLASIRHMIDVLSRMDGLRLAEPGEFTRRAYLNGKMDLLEAEGLADLIDADSSEQKRQAMEQMAGSGSKYYHELRDRIIRVLAHLEAYIDFPDEDIPESVLDGLGGQICEISALITQTLADSHRGERLREGFNVVILGAPNAGKSSLLNRLSGKDAAIVSHTAGTTRDVIEVSLDLNGFPVNLIDTAGLRESIDEIEEEGIRRARERASHADLKLILFDGTLSKMDISLLGMAQEHDIIVMTKADQGMSQLPDISIKNHILSVSSITGQGTDGLLAAITKTISKTVGAGQPAIITRARHRQMLEQARGHLNAWNTRLPLELACEELRQAAVAIGKITGKIQVDELLDVIFKQFCIGT
ncbi:MAG: tRNA uridine-5-carboxymethylaminomethyl(34) synthesis GTPase MnmE [Alphaproteobacteria bacterium]